MRPRSIATLFLGLSLALVSLHCSAEVEGETTGEEDAITARTRNFTTNPAIVQVDNVKDIYAVSDAHGQYEIFTTLLANNHLIDAVNPDPTKTKWTGGAATLVVAGDMIDKGPKSLDVIDLVRTLQADAPRSGGRVIATMGNHEAEFMADPNNKKATGSSEVDRCGIDSELLAAHIPPASLVKGTDPGGRGAWIANLPLGARVNKWFFSHGGNTSQNSIKDLEKTLEKGLTKTGFGDKDITGNDSILEAQNWYGDPTDPKAGKKAAAALGVDHIVFGHDPGAFGARGRVAKSSNGILVKIDTAMGIHQASGISQGFLLHVEVGGSYEMAEILDSSGNATPLL
ncbi:serine-threonine protein phosphatase [Labilithrix luteola]|uniref:Serine-threonine protein phosphatase n=1 Tax=Labilithrix luteola TaxID=1391654 RepID=A0A0K1PJI8_9BACT|nr:metallophosphoesterase [Labilithrix luteola]AKU93687.1 serine-threonine protein phosphatase [Labilithrix luteola]